MLRTKIWLIAVTFLAWTGSAWALGLGEIEASSKLNQPLTALIPISSATPKELESLVVELASNEDFERSGMERSEYLSTLRFEIQGDKIRVASKQLAREPFVSFLLNVRWDGGRLLREYTLLLDPPTMAEQKKTPAPAPAARPPQAAPAPAETASTTAEPAAATAEPEYTSPPDAPPDPPPAAEAPAMAASGGSYGPIQPQETLWSIAYKLRPDANSITMDQMQVAIFNANPQAFKDGRLTGLMKGSVLRVPTADEIRAVNPDAAKSQVASSRSDSYQAPVAKRAPVIAAAPAPAPVEPEAAAPAQPEPTPEPAPEPVVAPPTETAPPAAAPSAGDKNSFSTTPAVSETTTSAPPDSAQAPASQPPASEVTVAPAPSPAETPAAQTPPPEQTVAAAPPVEPAPAAPVIKEPKYNVEWMPMVSAVTDRGRELVSHPWAIPAAAGFFALLFGLFGFKKLRNKYAQWSYNRASAKIAAKSAEPISTSTDKTEVQPPAGKSTLDVMQDEAATVVNTASGRGLAATQAISPAMAATQAMAAQSLQTQSMDATQQSTMQQTVQQEPAMAKSGARQVDFDVTGQYSNETVQINLDAGDPVSEAEFHRAYGLYDEAALLLNQALQKDPKRTDARVKLAEIYFESSKAAEFVGVAKELKGQLPDDEWQKIALLGSQIAPSDPLFTGATAGGAGASVDLSFDDPAPAPAAAAPVAAAPAPVADNGMLDFKLEDFEMSPSPSTAPATPAVAAAPKGEALEFDLGGLSLDTPAAGAGTAGGEVQMEGLDLGNFDLGEPGAAPASGVSGSESIELSAEAPMEATSSVGVGGDDSGTKLDLARAYVDMGDNDMAKSLLNEVLQQGNDQQKKEAQELLQRVPA